MYNALSKFKVNQWPVKDTVTIQTHKIRYEVTNSCKEQANCSNRKRKLRSEINTTKIIHTICEESMKSVTCLKIDSD